jgi:uncharacterized repeat protein (TIGR02543 family)
MKRKNVISLVLAVLLLISLLTACGSNVPFKIDFIVDGDVYHTVDSKGNEEIQLPADPEKEGYIFDGWYWDKDTWEKPFTANSILDAPLSENMSVYAKWKTEGENEVQTYTITFNSNGGGDVSAITKEAGESITEPTAPTKTGYIFNGWYTDNGTFENAFEFDVMPAESLILYAKWIEDEPQPIEYTISFDSNSGSSVTAITKEAGESITEPTAPTKTGYTFDGWYTDNNIFIDKYIFNTMPEESFTLYAKWIWDGQNDFDTNGYYLVDNYIWFGEYPQTIKANDVTITETIDGRGYYLGSDGYYYAKVTATPNSSGYRFSTNATVTSGTVYYFKVEPIKWRILEESDGTALILCESIIANKRYAASSNNYMNSEIRAWLNNEFYNTAFSDLQQQLIQVTNVDNSVYSTGYSSNPYACANTNDKIFLPSYREMVNTAYGFPNSIYSTATRERLTSDYSRATGADMGTRSSYYGNGYWWLRSPYYFNSYFARYINIDGNVNYDYYVNYTNYGVVPALTIKLS